MSYSSNPGRYCRKRRRLLAPVRPISKTSTLATACGFWASVASRCDAPRCCMWGWPSPDGKAISSCFTASAIAFGSWSRMCWLVLLLQLAVVPLVVLRRGFGRWAAALRGVVAGLRGFPAVWQERAQGAKRRVASNAEIARLLKSGSAALLSRHRALRLHPLATDGTVAYRLLVRRPRGRRRRRLARRWAAAVRRSCPQPSAAPARR